jgi:hypothetical protein
MRHRKLKGSYFHNSTPFELGLQITQDFFILYESWKVEKLMFIRKKDIKDIYLFSTLHLTTHDY